LQDAVAKPFFVILNEVKDLELIERTRFFAPLRMTRSLGMGFCNSFQKKTYPSAKNSTYPLHIDIYLSIEGSIPPTPKTQQETQTSLRKEGGLGQ
jgi:hypothetical protein